MRIRFFDSEYKLFFQNELTPFEALNYADDVFFQHFERLCGRRYRILSQIEMDRQTKYGLVDDVLALEEHFADICGNTTWIVSIVKEYDEASYAARTELRVLRDEDTSGLSRTELAGILTGLRDKFAPLDAMSNMLHMFAEAPGPRFYESLGKYSDDAKAVTRNFEHFTQPLRPTETVPSVDEACEGQFVLTDYDAAMSRVLRVGAYVKDDVASFRTQRREAFIPLLGTIAGHVGLDHEDLQSFQVGEIVQMLEGSHEFDPKVLSAARSEVTVLHYPHDSLVIREGEEARRFLEEVGRLQILEAMKTAKLSGQIASRGTQAVEVISGRAVVAANAKEVAERIESGDVLVAMYTDGEFVPAMKVASAIVTETGGITSHAAAVARELGKPCLIAVEHALAIIPDGSRIEIDLSEATVRLLD